MSFTNLFANLGVSSLRMDEDVPLDIELSYGGVEFIGFVNGNWGINVFTPLGRLYLQTPEPQRVDGVFDGFDGTNYRKPIPGTDPPESYSLSGDSPVFVVAPLSGSSGSSQFFWSLSGGTPPTINQVLSSTARELIDIGSPLSIGGSPFADYLIGGTHADLVVGGDDNDTIVGVSGGDTIFGGTGQDSIVGGEGIDVINGDEGNDIIEGGSEGDFVFGGLGSDTITGGLGDDLLQGGEGNDVGFGGDGSDSFVVSRSATINSGSNIFYGGNTQNDFSDFLNASTTDYIQYDRPKSNFTLRSDPFSPSIGVTLIATHNGSDASDSAIFVDEIRFLESDGSISTWSQSDVIAAGWVAHLFFALDQAHSRLQEVLALPEIDENDPSFSPGFKKFLGWITLGQKIAQVGADIASASDLQEAIQRASVIAVREAIFPVIDQTSEWAEGLIEGLPSHLQEMARDKLNALEAELKDAVLVEADNFGSWYSAGVEAFGEALGEAAVELWQNVQTILEESHNELNPNGAMEQTADEFGLDEIDPDPDLYVDPPIVPNPESPNPNPTEEDEIIVLPPLAHVISGTLSELNGDSIFFFSDDDKILVLNQLFGPESVTVTFGSAVLEIDTNLDGTAEAVITLEGEFQDAQFIVEEVDENTQITVAFPSTNSAPLAQDDVLFVDEDQVLISNVLDDNGNGIDSDPDGDALTVSLISGPLEGSLILNDDGSFTYAADADVFDLAAPGEVIDQTFIYQIDDGNGESDQATVSISVSIQADGETIIGMNKRDTLEGTDGGEDVLNGKNADDTIYGLDGADTLLGGRGDDSLFGGESADSLFGEKGNDQLQGDQGEDYLDGGRGNDVLRGGTANDTLLGGRGDDLFVLALGEGTDTILDYGVGEDLIGLVGLTFEDLTIQQSGDDATISSGSEALAVLTGVDAFIIDEADVFNFV